MKLLACALTLLLAVGSQAFAYQSHAPAQLEQVQAAVTMYLNQVRDSLQRALDHLDGTEYAPYKVKLSETLDKLQDYVQTLIPYGKAYSNQFLWSINQILRRMMADMEDLRTQLEPMGQELDQFVHKQYREEYRDKLQEYMNAATPYIDQIRLAADQIAYHPEVVEMRAKMEATVEETKTKLVPMIEAVRTKLTNQLGDLKNYATPYVEEYKEELTNAVNYATPYIEEYKQELTKAVNYATPYVEEYKEQLTKAVVEVKHQISPHTQVIKTRLEPYRPYMEDLQNRFMPLYETIVFIYQI